MIQGEDTLALDLSSLRLDRAVLKGLLGARVGFRSNCDRAP